MYAIALYSAHTCLLQLLSHTMARTLVVENFIYLFLLADREDIIFNVTAIPVHDNTRETPPPESP